MKKIKSVKLKREYRDASHIMAEGQYGVKWFDEEEKKTFWKFATQRTSYSFCENTITGNKTDLFEIEYEEEERKYIDVRVEYYDDSLLGDLCLHYFKKFEEYLKWNCSDERKVELTIKGRGTL